MPKLSTTIIPNLAISWTDYPRANNKTPSQVGFTLLELLVSITVLAIIITLAYPSIITKLQDYEAKRIKRTLQNAISLAKATSYSRRKRVFMCLLNESGVCDKNGDKQLVLFFDKDNNSSYQAKKDSVLQLVDLNLSYAFVNLRAGGRHYVRFAADTGTPRGFFGHFKYCPHNKNNLNKYQLSFNQVGGIRFKPNSKVPTGC